MCRVNPSLTHTQLKKTVQQTKKGYGLTAGLPGVEPDAHKMDRRAHKVNRELATRIGKALHALKPHDKGKPRFVLGWRLYPNRDNEFWKDMGGVHNCGCGCACHSNPAPRKRKR